MRGGVDLGALTLLRWYAAHVFLLPAALIGFTVAHLYLMRRHGISGPITPVAGPAKPFYPYHALKDTIVVAVVFALLLTLALNFPAPLDAVADPSDATYIPRPEWYFLSLFQLLKYLPGPLEPVATMVIPGSWSAACSLLPFLDRRPDRTRCKRPIVTAAFVLLAIVADADLSRAARFPAHADPNDWAPLSLAGCQFAQDQRCQTCHRIGGAANPMRQTILRKDPEWLIGHVARSGGDRPRHPRGAARRHDASAGARRPQLHVACPLRRRAAEMTGREPTATTSSTAASARTAT